MDLFGAKEHEARHEEVEKQLRTLYEQVAQLTIELGEARADISRLEARLDSSVEIPDAEAIDEDLADARVKLRAARAASEEAWKDLYPQLLTSLGKVREAIDDAGAREREPNDG